MPWWRFFENWQCFTLTSTDNGHTWSDPEQFEPLPRRTFVRNLYISTWNTWYLPFQSNDTESDPKPSHLKDGSNKRGINGVLIIEDEGKTWRHFRNLESLDDRTRIQPPGGPPRIYRARREEQPTDRHAYPHAPGVLRICYPTVVVTEGEVAIAYDYGFGTSGLLENGHATKIKIVSVDWLYQRE